MALVESLPPKPLGYEVDFPIGSGGMATVSYGRRISAGGFAHAVAIKQLHPHLASNPEVVSMFLDEARLAARVVHANVVSILDVVQQGNDVWAVMQYIEGEALSSLLREAAATGRPVPLPVAVAIAIDLLAGLEAAHAATDERGEPLGIVHRDVSPQNVLVGADGVARVFDFGVAKAHGRLHQTRDGQVKGKLAYMSPEQLGGEANVSTDVYAAAIVIWEVLAGRRLFVGDSEIAVMGNVLAGAVSPPSKHADVPPALDAVVMRALSLEPAKRFASAAALSRALTDGCPVAVATRAEVAAWVEDVAGKAIGARRARAFEVARSTTAASVAKSEETVAPFVSTVVIPRQPAAAPPRSARRLWPAGLALLAAAALAMGARALVRSESREPPNAATAQSVGPPTTSHAEAPLAASPSANAPELQSDSAAAPGTPHAASTSHRTGGASGAAGRRSPGAPNAPVPITSAPTDRPGLPPKVKPAAEDCDPPFVLDASGMRHYKRSCIR